MDTRAPLISGHEAILDRLVDIALAAGPIAAQTDKYLTNTHRIVEAHGDFPVTFAIFAGTRARVFPAAAKFSFGGASEVNPVSPGAAAASSRRGPFGFRAGRRRAIVAWAP